MIWRLRTSSSILCLVHVLIMIYSLFLSLCILHAPKCRKFITNVPHVLNIASQSMGKVYFETF